MAPGAKRHLLLRLLRRLMAAGSGIRAHQWRPTKIARSVTDSMSSGGQLLGPRQSGSFAFVLQKMPDKGQKCRHVCFTPFSFFGWPSFRVPSTGPFD